MKSDLGRRPLVGLALSGGGARGLAHIGVLKVLEREGIPVACLAGTSMGGLIAAGYAAGLSPAELEREALERTRWRNLLRLVDLEWPRRGLVRGSQLLAYFERSLGRRTFADMRLPLALIAVDLNSGREVVLREGQVALAVRATVALPGILAPVEIEDRRLVDGGLLNNLPADVARQMGAEVVIAVDVTPGRGSHWLGNFRKMPKSTAAILSVLGDSLVVMMAALNEQRLRQARPEVLIRPVIPPGVNALAGYNRAQELIAAGECATEAALPEIHRQIGKQWD